MSNNPADKPQDFIRVLHIDDEQSQLMLVKRFLEDADSAIRVVSVSSSEEAQALLQQRVFDCVVSDYVMPRINGIEFARRVREESGIPFILYTGHGSENVAETAFAAGIDDYFRKEPEPSHYRLLAKRIRASIERYQAQERLKESELKYRTLVEQSLQGIIIAQGVPPRLVFANPSISKIFGYALDELLSLSPAQLMNLVHPEEEGFLLKRYKELLEGKPAPLRYEFQGIKKDGTPIWVELLAIRIEYMRKPAIQATFLDITERKRVVEELEESRRHFRTLFDIMVDPVVIVDGKGKILEVTDRFEKVTGYKREDLLDKNFLNINVVAEEDKTLLKKNLMKRLKGTASSPYVVEVVTIDGDKILFEVNSQKIEFVGKPAVMAVFRDITTRKFYEERLQALHNHVLKLASAEDIKQVSEMTLEVMEAVLGFEFISFQIVEDKKLITLGTRGYPSLGIPLPLEGKGITVRAARERRTIYVPDVRDDPDFIRGERESLSELAVPALSEGVTVAILNVERRQLDAFAEPDRNLLETLAGHVASVIERLRKEEKEKRYEKRLEALHRHATELSSAETIEEIARLTFDAVELVLGFQWGDFSIIEGNKLVPVYIKGIDLKSFGELPLNGPGVTVRAVKTGESQLISDTRKDEDYVEVLVEGEKPSLSELVVPVKVESHVVAIINLENEAINAFRIEDQKLLETLALHVASAIERLKNENMLQSSEERYQTLLESSRDAVCVIADERYAYVNNCHAELLGFSDPSDLIGRKAIEFVAPEDKERVLEMIRGRPKGEKHPDLYELKMQRKNGTAVDVETHVSVIEYDGKPASLAFTRDITDRKQMEEEIIKSEERWRSLVELAPDGIITIDTKGVITSVNTAFIKFAGFSKDELLGKDVTKLGIIRSKDIQSYLNLFNSILGGKITPSIEFVYQHKNGTTGWAEGHFSLIKVGEKREILIICREITRRKEIEDELRDYAENLEEIVKEKTNELLAAESIASAGKVAAMVGHDLRGPLQTIKSAIYLLMNKSDNAENVLALANDAVDRAVNMLEEIRNRTRDTPLRIVTTDLTTLIKTAVEEAPIPSFIDLTCELGEGLEAVTLDPRKMRRVLDNLLANALDAMPQGGGLEISAKVEDESVLIKVSDTGVGITEEDKRNLFKPFYTTKPKGMGLGLVYCKRAVEAHGGTITVESNVGEGTKFTIKLPHRCKSNKSYYGMPITSIAIPSTNVSSNSLF